MGHPRVAIRRLGSLVFAATVLAAAAAAAANAGAGSPPPPAVGPQSSAILVRFRPNARAAELTQLHASHNAWIAGGIQALGIVRVEVGAGRAEAAAAAYSASGLVEFAEEDSVVQTQFTPNDPYYSSGYATARFGKIGQWAPQFISAPAAWDVTQGDPSITIAIIDTGIDAGHPDLAGKVTGGTSFTGKLADENGHGTHVAGIAAANTNNGTGVAGICPRCSVMPVRVLDANGSGYLSDVTSGIIYAADHGARVINLSLGGPSASQTMRAAVEYALARNALTVAAMGNSSAPTALEPAYWHSALSVAAVDQAGARAQFSNYGTQTDVAAPGVAILSTLPTYGVALNQTYSRGYDALSGTSMAAPVVSGLAGLILSRNPALTATQVRGIIEASAGDGKSFTPETGFGVVNAARAIALAAHADAIAPSLNISSPAPASTVAREVALMAAPADASGVHHVDFVVDGVRAGSPGVAGGAGGRKTTATAAWSSAWDSRTVWNGPRTVTAVAVDTAGNARSADVPFTVSNAYATATWSMHLCNPATPQCPYYGLKSLPLAHPAVARVQVNWAYTASSGYSNATMWASIFDGWNQQLLFTQASAIDFYPDVRLCGCTKNSVGAGMAGTLRRGGGAAADVTVTVTYPD